MILNPWIWDRSRAKSEKPLVSFEDRYFTAISFDFLSRCPEKDATNLGNFFILKSKKLWWTFDSLNWIHHLYPTSNQMTHPISVNIQIEVLKSPKLGSAPKKTLGDGSVLHHGRWLQMGHICEDRCAVGPEMRHGSAPAWGMVWNYHLSSGC